MDKNNTEKINRFLALVLRHKPELLGIELDEYGWVRTDKLIDAMNDRSPYDLDRELLDYIVETDDERRYSYTDDGRFIRANGGHSVPVGVELGPSFPPAVLYHGTDEHFAHMIDKSGLLASNDLYVHLTADLAKAKEAGGKHGRPVVYQVNSRQMELDGYEFFLSENQVWLTKTVPVEYLTVYGS